MSQIGVKESRFAKVIEGLRMAWAALSVNEEVISDNVKESELNEIRKNENRNAIRELEESQKWNNTILLEGNEYQISLKAQVSEKMAQKKLEEKEILYREEKEINPQQQIGE